ncbi:hypothetical protein ACVWWO_000198 [Bradyrhizobium sp. F1.13.1]
MAKTNYQLAFKAKVIGLRRSDGISTSSDIGSTIV